MPRAVRQYDQQVGATTTRTRRTRAQIAASRQSAISSPAVPPNRRLPGGHVRIEQFLGAPISAPSRTSCAGQIHCACVERGCPSRDVAGTAEDPAIHIAAPRRIARSVPRNTIATMYGTRVAHAALRRCAPARDAPGPPVRRSDGRLTRAPATVDEAHAQNERADDEREHEPARAAVADPTAATRANARRPAKSGRSSRPRRRGDGSSVVHGPADDVPQSRSCGPARPHPPNGGTQLSYMRLPELAPRRSSRVLRNSHAL